MKLVPSRQYFEPTEDAIEARRRICEVCGQEVDLSDPDQIFHHGPEPHDPLV